MKNVNLFPYRQQHKWQLTRAFQKAVIATAAFSLLVAALLAWAFSPSGPWRWLQPHVASNAQLAVQPEQQVLIEQLYQHIQSTQKLQAERQLRIKLLRLIHALAQNPTEGVWVKQLQWADGFLLIDAWTQSAEQTQVWVQHLQTIDGVTGMETLAAPADARANEMSMQVVRLQLNLGGGHVRP